MLSRAWLVALSGPALTVAMTGFTRAELIYSQSYGSSLTTGIDSPITLSGSVSTYANTGSPTYSFWINNTTSAQQASTRDITFNFTGSINPLIYTVNGDSNRVYIAGYLSSQGGNGKNGSTDFFDDNAPTTGGTSGGYTINATGASINTTAYYFTGPVQAIYGLRTLVQGSNGGNSDGANDSQKGGAFGQFANGINTNLTGVNFTLDAFQVGPNIGTGAVVSSEQVGGQGGTAGQGSGSYYNQGGQGGTPKPQTAIVTDSTLRGSGQAIAGLVLSQIGGRGGDGYTNETRSSGGPGAGGQGVTLQFVQGSGGGTSISTDGTTAPAVKIVSIGGDGGNGAVDSGVSANGGNGGSGATPSSQSIPNLTTLSTNVGVFNTGTVTLATTGSSSPGLTVQNAGGKGGNSADLSTLAGADSGYAGAGGSGGNVTVSLQSGARITTSGSSSAALQILATGGAGGVAGGSAGTTNASSGNGGRGGSSGVVTVNLGGGVSLSTSGLESHGVFVQGRGGDAGKAQAAKGVFAGNGGNGGSGGSTGTVSVTNAGSITTTGDSARGVFVQVRAGLGGAGANADSVTGNNPGDGGSAGSNGAITLTNSGTIQTSGSGAQGILAMSLGGNGGSGGSGSGAFIAGSGDGGSSSLTSGGTVTVTTTAGSVVRTGGFGAAGVLAQSVGGGGGDGGNASGIIYGDGSSGGTGGSGSTIAANLAGAITTTNTISHGAVAQSIGGGGGNGGNVNGAGVPASLVIGGSAGDGGSGGAVTVVTQGLNITASGSGSNGIVAQSIGGGGGTGGSATGIAVGSPVLGLLTPVTISIAASVGGKGGGGGTGQGVSVYLGDTTIQTGRAAARTGTPPVDAFGIVAQSVGGGGGLGGGASAYSITVPEVTGGKSFEISAAYAQGGSGGGGGAAGSVQVQLATSSGGTSGAATVLTAGAGSHGVLAQSVGGGGGSGGDSSAMAATIGGSSKYGANGADTVSVTASSSVGGAAGDGSNGGAVTVNGAGGSTPLTVGTTGDYAYGLIAQSVGGGGGNAGLGSADFNYTGSVENSKATVSVGRQGGSGGNGGGVTVSLANTATIRTAGSAAVGVLAQSVGGGGGTGTGSTVNVATGLFTTTFGKSAQLKFTPAVSVSVGSQGGGGGSGGTVSLTNQGSVTTLGNDAPALVAQSVGGGGGIGGSAGNDETDGGDASEAPSEKQVRTARTARSTGARNETPSSNPILPNVEVETTLTVAVGGKGGSAGNGGEVTLRHGGVVTTSGDFSQGLVAQSIGGGGGRGGVAAGGGEGNSIKSVIGSGIINSTVTLGVANGNGGAAGNGGSVNVNFDGGSRITTGLRGQGNVLGTGFQAIGVLAQSIGAGGGTAADGTVEPNGLLNLGAGYLNNSGPSGTGGAVLVRQLSSSATNAIQTYGDSAHGMVLQSIGGGGGVAGFGSTLAPGVPIYPTSVTLQVGGTSNASGDGGTVTVDSPILSITTAGIGAYGLVAQSIGGGGGLADVTGSVASLGRLGGGSTNGSGKAVAVTLDPNSRITTTGLGSHGIIAQSIGGGGGIVTALQAGVTPAYNDPPALGTYSNGSGGTVTVVSNGAISTSGNTANGIWAQSVSGGGGIAAIGSNIYGGVFTQTSVSTPKASDVTVTAGGPITTTGAYSSGILAQSSNSQGYSAGTVTVNIGGPSRTAAVSGGTGEFGYGVWIIDGNDNNNVHVYPGSSLTALSNQAVKYNGTFKFAVLNEGTITGSVNGGSKATFTNNGTWNASSTGTGQAVATANVVLGPSSKLATTVDFANRTAGSFVVLGDAALGGQLQPALLSVVSNVRVPVLTVTGAATGQVAAPDSALFGFQLQRSGGTYSLAATSQRFADPRFGLTAQASAVAGHLGSIFETSSTGEYGAFFAGLDSFAAAQPAEYARRLGELGPKSSATVTSRRAGDAASIANASMSCPVFSGATSFLTEGSCAYARAGGRTSSDGGGSSSLRLDTATWQIGGQYEAAPGWFVGGSLAYESNWLKGDDGVSGRGNGGSGALTLKRQEGPWLFTGAVFGSVGGFDLQRVVNIPGIGGVAKGSPTTSSVGGRLRAAYTVGEDALYVRPYVNVDLIHARSGGYTEYGVAGYGLKYDGASQTTAVFTPAVEVGMRSNLGPATVLRSYVSAGVDLRTNDEWKVRSRLVGAPAGADGFTTSVTQDRAAARVGAGLQLFSGQRLDVRAQYDGVFSGNVTSHGGTLTLGWRL